MFYHTCFVTLNLSLFSILEKRKLVYREFLIKNIWLIYDLLA